jgi:hypothetical protein
MQQVNSPKLIKIYFNYIFSSATDSSKLYPVIFAAKIVYTIRLVIPSVRAICLPNLTCVLKNKRMNYIESVIWKNLDFLYAFI